MTLNRVAVRVAGRDTMPIPPIERHMERHNVGGAVSIGVEYRVITEDVVAASGVAEGPISVQGMNDKGVSLHVYVKGSDGDLERLRFDCFEDDPHYHYVCWSAPWHDVVFFDDVANGDLMVWALTCIRTRLAQMLTRAGLPNASQVVDQSQLEAALPRVTEAAYRARFHSDSDRVTEVALSLGERLRA
jgi:hypothetical protein